MICYDIKDFWRVVGHLKQSGCRIQQATYLLQRPIVVAFNSREVVMCVGGGIWVGIGMVSGKTWQNVDFGKILCKKCSLMCLRGIPKEWEGMVLNSEYFSCPHVVIINKGGVKKRVRRLHHRCEVKKPHSDAFPSKRVVQSS